MFRVLVSVSLSTLFLLWAHIEVYRFLIGQNPWTPNLRPSLQMSHHQHAPIAPKSSGRAARLAAGSLTTQFGKMSFQLPLRWSQSGVSLFQATPQAARQKFLALSSSGDMRSWPWFLGPGIHHDRTAALARTQEFLFLVQKVSVFAQNHLGTRSRKQMRVILLYKRPAGLFGVILKGLKKVSWRA